MTKSILFATLLLLALSLSSFTAKAQDTTPVPAVKNWSHGLGHWVNEEEQRNAPDEPWQKVSSEWNNKMMPGGFFVETPGKMTFQDGSMVSWVQVWGYDPVRKATFNHWYDSWGNQGRGTFAWNGTTLKGEGDVVLADGTTFKSRCTQEQDTDARTMEMTCERLTDGTWWVNRKVKGKRVD